MRLKKRGEEFVTDYGTEFPKNPRIGTLFSRTDLDHQVFVFIGDQWIGLAQDKKMSFPATTTKVELANPIDRGVLKNTSGTTLGSANKPPDEKLLAEKLITQIAEESGGSTTIKQLYDSLREGVNEEQTLPSDSYERPDFIDGEFKSLHEQKSPDAPVDKAHINTEEFGMDGSFKPVNNCSLKMTNIPGLFIENSNIPTTPFRDCICEGAPSCPVIPEFTVDTIETAPDVPPGYYRLRWSRPVEFYETVWNYHIHGKPTAFPSEGDRYDLLYEGTGNAQVGVNSKLVTINGATFTENQYKGKVFTLKQGDCKFRGVIVANSATVLTLNVTVPWPYDVYDCEIVEPCWTYSTYEYNYAMWDDTGGVLADRLAEEFTWYVPYQGDAMNFQIHATNWWGDGPDMEGGAAAINPIPDPPAFVSVIGELGTTHVTVSGLSPTGYYLDGYELSYSTTYDTVPSAVPVDDIKILYSETGSFTFTTNKPVYMYARSCLGIQRSEWIGYGQLVEGQELETLLFADDLLTHTADSPVGYVGSWFVKRGIGGNTFYYRRDAWSGTLCPFAYTGSELDGVWGNLTTEFSSYGGRIESTLRGFGGLGYFAWIIGTTAANLSTIGGPGYWLQVTTPSTWPMTIYLEVWYCYNRTKVTLLARSQNLHPSPIIYGDGYGRVTWTWINYGDQGLKIIGSVEGPTVADTEYIGGDITYNITTELTPVTGPLYVNNFTYDNSTVYAGLVHPNSKNLHQVSTDAECSAYPAYQKENALLIYKRNAVGRIIQFNPGRALDVIQNDDINEVSEPYAISELVRMHSNNALDDYLYLDLDNNRRPHVDVYNPIDTLVETVDIPTLDQLRLDRMLDVDIDNPTEGDMVFYESDNKWRNRQLSDIHYHNSINSDPVTKRVLASVNEIEFGKVGFAYKRPIVITNTVAELTNYPVKITVDTAALISSNKLKVTGEDIRFVDPSGNALNYWYQPETFNTASTIFWVKVPTVPNGASTIYAYYCDEHLNINSSNGSSVFDIFDDFSGYPIGDDIDGYGGWNTDSLIDPNGAAKIIDVGGKNHLKIRSGTYFWYTSISKELPVADNDYEAHVRFQVINDSGPAGISLQFSDGIHSYADGNARTAYEGIIDNRYLGIWKWNNYVQSDLAASSSVFNLVANAYYSNHFRWSSNVLTTHTYASSGGDSGNVRSETATNSDYSTASHISLCKRGIGTGYVDYIFVKKAPMAEASEPTAVVGTEASLRDIIVSMDLSTNEVVFEKGIVTLIEIPTGDIPSAATNYGKIYVKVNDRHPYYLDSLGDEFDLLDYVGSGTGDLIIYQFADTVTGNILSIPLPSGASEDSILVFHNGLCLTSGSAYDYEIVSGVVEFTSGHVFSEDDILTIRYVQGNVVGGGSGTSDGTFTTDIELPSNAAIYLGDKTTDGTWRIIRSGINLNIEVRVSGSYVAGAFISTP